MNAYKIVVVFVWLLLTVAECWVSNNVEFY